jgi:hypothetical protein
VIGQTSGHDVKPKPSTTDLAAEARERELAAVRSAQREVRRHARRIEHAGLSCGASAALAARPRTARAATRTR